MSGFFCFVPLHGTCGPQETIESEQPEGWLVEPMADGPTRQWLVAECSCADEDAPLPDSFERVPERLARALRSAKRYYPAIALARESLERDKSQLPDDKGQYAERLADEIERHLAGQREAPYFLAQATKACLIGYRFAGEYVWVVAYDPRTKHVFWVTDDYFVYNSPLGDFTMEEEQVRSLPVHCGPVWWPRD